MLKLISNVSRRGLVLGALALCLGTTTAWAVNVQFPFLFPGIDAGGNLSDEIGTESSIKVSVNTKSGKFHASGKAQVQNLSGKNQTYNNSAVNIPGVTLKSSRYSCSKKGKASVAASGMADI